MIQPKHSDITCILVNAKEVKMKHSKSKLNHTELKDKKEKDKIV